MCFECLNNKSTHKHKEKKYKEAEILACYEKAGDLALLYLQVSFNVTHSGCSADTYLQDLVKLELYMVNNERFWPIKGVLHP